MSLLVAIVEILKALVELARFVERNKEEQWFKETTASLATIREAPNAQEKAREIKKYFDLLNKPH